MAHLTLQPPNTTVLSMAMRMEITEKAMLVQSHFNGLGRSWRASDPERVKATAGSEEVM